MAHFFWFCNMGLFWQYSTVLLAQTYGVGIQHISGVFSTLVGGGYSVHQWGGGGVFSTMFWGTEQKLLQRDILHFSAEYFSFQQNFEVIAGQQHGIARYIQHIMFEIFSTYYKVFYLIWWVLQHGTLRYSSQNNRIFRQHILAYQHCIMRIFSICHHNITGLSAHSVRSGQQGAVPKVSLLLWTYWYQATV